MNWQPWLEFFVPGVPKPAGSKSGFIIKGRDGKQHVNMVDSCKGGKEWRKNCAATARLAYRGPALGKEPLRLAVTFYMPRPKNHYRTGRFSELLKATAECYHLQKPDTTKLYRCIEDAFTGILYEDDSTIISQDGTCKEWANCAIEQGAQVTLYRIPGSIWEGEEL